MSFVFFVFVVATADGGTITERVKSSFSEANEKAATKKPTEASEAVAEKAREAAMQLTKLTEEAEYSPQDSLAAIDKQVRSTKRSRNECESTRESAGVTNHGITNDTN